MPDLLVQSSTTARKDKKLADEAAHVRQICQAEHGKKALVECPDCYEKVLEAFRSRYLRSPDDEWFKSRDSFLQELAKLIAEAKEYQLDPAAVDSRVQGERTKWYLENVRECLVGLGVEDAAARDAILEKLEEPPSDITDLTEDVAALFRNRYPRLNADVASISDRLASAPDQDSRLEILKEAFFTPNGSGGDEGPKTSAASYEKYYNMLKVMNVSMDQATGRILEDSQSAMGTRAQADKLRARLAELKRARAAHELEKKKKAKTLANSVKNSVPDELYNLPPCAACGETPGTDSFLCCPVCDILASRGVQEQRTVYCSSECRDKGYDEHMEAAHTCSAGDNCIQLRADEDAIAEDDGRRSEGMSSNIAQFCSECLTSLRQPRLWCSAECAAHDFQAHRENVHVPERKKPKLSVADEDQLVYDEERPGDKAPSPGADVSRKPTIYHAKDISSHLIPFDEAVREWEKENSIEMSM